MGSMRNMQRNWRNNKWKDLPNSPANDCQICLMSNTVHNSAFSIVFSHTYSTFHKIYLNSGQWRVKIGYFCLIISWRISRWHLDIRKNVKKLSKYLVYLLNSKTTCDCLTWMFLYKELYKPWKWFTADLSFLGCFFLLATAARN